MKKLTLSALLGAAGIAGMVALGQTGAVAQTDDAALMAALMTEGEVLFNDNCAPCHGTDGQGQNRGLPGPNLVGNPFLESAGAIIGQILLGNPEHGMPGFAHLADREVAAIGTYVRNSWGNAYGIVREAAVGIRRAPPM
jgi:mono/diheme cytochrome c family protein